MKKAFTLAETLITLVIIGVVAALTIPTLNSNINNAENIAKAKKSYQALSNSMAMITLKGYVPVFVPQNDNMDNIKNWFDRYLKDNLSVMKVCYNQKGCWHDGDTYGLDNKLVYYSRDGQIGADVVTVILSDGTFLNIDSYGKASMWTYFGVNIPTEYGIVVLFDVNGARKPNKLGKDIFATVYDGESLVPAYRDKTEEEVKINCSSSGSGYSCLHQLLTTK